MPAPTRSTLDRKGDPAENLADAIERGKAYLDAGAPVVFVPGDAQGGRDPGVGGRLRPRKLTTIGVPGSPPRDWQEEHGVARTSFGPLSLNVALTALQELVEEVHRGGGTPANLRFLT